MDASALQPSRIQLKVRDRDPDSSLAICALLGAEPGGEVRQRDTYFQGDRGRLWIREEEGGGAHLFADERLVLAGAPPRRWKFDVAQPDVVLHTFALSLGVETVVVKHRQLLHCDEVRIHLDEVEDLGCFLELQAEVRANSDPAPARAQLNTLLQALGIEDDDLVIESYADLRLLGAPMAFEC